MSQKEAISKAPSGRVTRTPVAQRNILNVKGKDPAYHYRIVNDNENGDNIERRLGAGYEIVSDANVQVGDKRASAASIIGSAKHFSVGGGQKAVLMRTPKEYYEEDMLALANRADAQEQQITEKALSGTYGKLEINRS